VNKAQALRREAKALLGSAKNALRYLIHQDPPTQPGARADYDKIVSELSVVISRADPPQSDVERHSSFRLVMTKTTCDEILSHLRAHAKVSAEDQALLQEVEEGVRVTKQRVYVQLGFNPALLRRLRFILKTTSTKKQDKAFLRLAQEITDNGLSMNPMEVLAQMGL